MNLDKAQTEAEIARTASALAYKARRLEQRLEHVVDPREYVRAYPWRSVAAAFTVGLLMGRLS